MYSTFLSVILRFTDRHIPIIAPKKREVGFAMDSAVIKTGEHCASLTDTAQ